MTGIIKVTGFIAIAPAIPDLVELRAALRDIKTPDVRGYFIVGGADSQALEATSRITELMKMYDMKFQIETHENLGHEFPSRFEESLARAIQFLID